MIQPTTPSDASYSTTLRTVRAVVGSKRCGPVYVAGAVATLRSAVYAGWNRTRRNRLPRTLIGAPEPPCTNGGLAGSTMNGGVPTGVVARNVNVTESAHVSDAILRLVSNTNPAGLNGPSVRPLVPTAGQGTMVELVTGAIVALVPKSLGVDQLAVGYGVFYAIYYLVFGIVTIFSNPKKIKWR